MKTEVRVKAGGFQPYHNATQARGLTVTSKKGAMRLHRKRGTMCRGFGSSGLIVLLLLAVTATAAASAAPLPTFKVLVFSKTEGYRHASIPNGITAIQLQHAVVHR